jgi:hypothetical protein
MQKYSQGKRFRLIHMAESMRAKRADGSMCVCWYRERLGP